MIKAAGMQVTSKTELQTFSNGLILLRGRARGRFHNVIHFFIFEFFHSHFIEDPKLSPLNKLHKNCIIFRPFGVHNPNTTRQDNGRGRVASIIGPIETSGVRGLTDVDENRRK